MLRIVHPDLLDGAAVCLDREISLAAASIAGVSEDSVADVNEILRPGSALSVSDAQLQLQLPVKLGGCGFVPLRALAVPAYVAGLHLAFRYLAACGSLRSVLAEPLNNNSACCTIVEA